MMLIVILVVYK